MKFIIILITNFLIPTISMAQTLSFGKAVKQLYYNIDVKNNDIDSILKQFNQVASSYDISNGMYSLSINIDMDSSENAKKISHVFTFNTSPLPNTIVDIGYIKISVGETKNTKKILDIEWCFQFLIKNDAEFFFFELKKIFTPLSTIRKFGDDDLNLGKYAEFSTRLENMSEIRDVTFYLFKSAITNKYEIKFIPYNQFVE